MTGVSWLSEPEEHDYPGAGDYLDLIAGPHLVAVLVEGLRRTQNVHRKAKDILRASGLPLLPTDNPHVASDLKKIRKTQPLSPILLVRGDVTANRSAQIADSYHRVCASYHNDENTDIPCPSSTFRQVTDPTMLATIPGRLTRPGPRAAKREPTLVRRRGSTPLDAWPHGGDG